MAEERDPKVSRRYRELGTEEPPRELDQAILAAAHRAADHAHAPLVTPAGRHRWYFAFGAAAILVLAVAITVQVERQPDPEDRFYSQPEKKSKEQLEPSKPLADAAARPAGERRKAPAQQAAPAEAKPEAAEMARADRLEARQQQTPSLETQSAPAATPATPAPPQADSRDQSSPGAAAGMFSMQEGARKSREAAPAAAPSSAATNLLSPEQLLERIAELRKQGRHEEADKALAEFRQRYPGYQISDEMLKKVERPK